MDRTDSITLTADANVMILKLKLTCIVQKGYGDQEHFQMKTPERSHTSRISQIVQSFCPKILFWLWIERHTQIHYVTAYSSPVKVLTDTQTQGSDFMTSTAEAGGNHVGAYLLSDSMDSRFTHYINIETKTLPGLRI